MFNKKYIPVFFVIFFLLCSVCAYSHDVIPTPLGSTVVDQALKEDLNDEGKWTQVTFADDTTQTTAATNGIGNSSDTEILVNNDGVLDGAAPLTFTGTTLTMTGLMNITGRLTNSSAVLNIGAVASTSHSLISDDVLFGRQVEFNATCYFDGGVKNYSPFEFFAPAGSVKYAQFKTSEDDGFLIPLGNTTGVSNRNIIITDDVNRLKDHDHEILSSHPTLIGHSVTDPDSDNQQFWSMTHDTTKTVITSATGGLAAVLNGTFGIDSNSADTVAIMTVENTGGDFQIFRDDASPEGVITGNIGDECTDTTGGVKYLKTSGAGNTGWSAIGGVTVFKSYPLSNPGNAGTFYIGGHYAFAAAHEVLTIGGTVTRVFGTVGQAHGAHAFCVASGAGGTDLVLTVTGVSITDAGVKNDSDSEIIVADADAAITDQYFETSKKWLGQITYTLTGSSGAFTFNYGFVKYDDFGNKNFTITEFDMTGEARANETGLNVELLYHEATAFVYSAGAFVPNATPLISMATDYGTNNDVASGDGFAYKRSGLSTVVAGTNGEGILIRITTAVNNSINDAVAHLGISYN